MTLIKSLLLGSAAGLVAVSAAQAADLPTRKGPVAAEYVRVCSITVSGAPVVGFVLPGSDTCFKISGYMTGQVEAGNLSARRTIDYSGVATTQAKNAATTVFNRDSFGYTTRLHLATDMVSNTAYGPLVAHAEINFNSGSGFDNVGGGVNLNQGYVTWAGLTAGRIVSFFSFTGGGLAWANFFSPDRNGGGQPDVLAYTASFGGGLSATLALESPSSVPGYVSNSNYNFGTAGVTAANSFLGSATGGGLRAPDIVGALNVNQSWGQAHLSGVAHNVRATNMAGTSTLDTWGFGVDAGVVFNIPGMLPGSQIGLTGAWSKNDIGASGVPDGMWSEGGSPNYNGQQIALADAFANANGTWATPTAWSIAGWAQFQVSQPLTLGLEASYGQVNWSGTNPIGAGGSMLSNSKSFIVGGVANYTPVKNLVFEFELLYQSTTTARPTALTGTWDGSANGFAARFEVTRNF